MAYLDFFNLFQAEIATVGLQQEFPAQWLKALEAALPTGGALLNVPEYAFFATAIQQYTESLGDAATFHAFMEDVARKVLWIKQKPRGAALARKLSQASSDGPVSALFEIYTAWKLENDAGAAIRQLEPTLPGGNKKLDAEVTAGGDIVLIECFASLGSGLAESGALDGFWSPDSDPAVPKIRNKILDKADQAGSAARPVVLFIAPSADFLMPPDKIPHAVTAAFADPKSKCISAIAFSGGSHTYLCESIATYFENPRPTHPMGQAMKAVLDSLSPWK